MHRVIDARRLGRLLGAAVLGGALAAGALAALPAEAAVHSSSAVRAAYDLGDLSEDGGYSDTTGGTSGSDANGLNNSDANGLANGLNSGTQANGLANGL